MSAGHQLLTQLLNCVGTFVAHASASLFILLVVLHVVGEEGAIGRHSQYQTSDWF